MTTKFAYADENDVVEAKSARGKPKADNKLRSLEARPSVAKMFSNIATSRSFTAKAAHKAFAGVKYK